MRRVGEGREAEVPAVRRVGRGEVTRATAPATTLLAPGEAAKVIGIGSRTLAQWADAGRLSVVRTPGGHRRYKAAEVEALRDAGAR